MEIRSRVKLTHKLIKKLMKEIKYNKCCVFVLTIVLIFCEFTSRHLKRALVSDYPNHLRWLVIVFFSPPPSTCNPARLWITSQSCSPPPS